MEANGFTCVHWLNISFQPKYFVVVVVVVVDAVAVVVVAVVVAVVVVDVIAGEGQTRRRSMATEIYSTERLIIVRRDRTGRESERGT